MNQSENLSNLAKALSTFQAKLKHAPKDRVNPHFKNRYADLATVWDTIRENLASNGLAVVQRAQNSADGVTVITTVMHVSGEWMSDSCFLPVDKNNPQGFGSAITYARRYGLCAMLGVVADDDDDAEVASKPSPRVMPAGTPATAQPTQEDKDVIEDYLSAIRTASTKAELDKLVPEIGKLSEVVKAPVRRAYVAKVAELANTK